MRYKQIQFDTTRYNFVKVVSDLFDGRKLETLHEKHEEQFKVGMDSITSFHEMFYNKYRAGWPMMESLYFNFIADVVSPLYDEDFLYQKFPTFRVHLNENLAVGAFHTDAEFGHPSGEMNYIIPLTNSFNSASVWVESEPNKKDFEAMDMIVGKLIQFNGNELTHGNKTNDTRKTRCSMDFRVLPLSKYDEANNSESITRHTKFKEGEYYKLFSK